MRGIALCGLVVVATTLNGCATAIAPVDVARFHNGAPAPSGSIMIEVEPGLAADNVELRSHAAAVGQELQRLGFAEVTSAAPLVARVSFARTVRPPVETRRSPVSVGIGGSTGSYGSGLGVGIGIDLSGKPKDLIVSTLSVQIRRRADNAALWEGRATTQAREGTPAAQPGLSAAKLARALFGDYPGPSGQTISVK